MGEYVYGWAVLPKLGVMTVSELVALAKSKPGKLTYSVPGIGTATHLRGTALNILAGTEIVAIPYRGGPEALSDFLGGHFDIMLDSLHYPHVKAGRAIMLAMTSNRRHPDFPDVPTMAEAGYAIDLPTWLALYAIKGTPEAMGIKFGNAVMEVTARPEVNARIYTMGFFPMTQKPGELAGMNARETASYEAWVKRSGIKIE